LNPRRAVITLNRLAGGPFRPLKHPSLLNSFSLTNPSLTQKTGVVNCEILNKLPSKHLLLVYHKSNSQNNP